MLKIVVRNTNGRGRLEAGFVEFPGEIDCGKRRKREVGAHGYPQMVNTIPIVYKNPLYYKGVTLSH